MIERTCRSLAPEQSRNASVIASWSLTSYATMSEASFSAAASAAISVSSMALGVAVTWLARPPRSEMPTAFVSHAYASAFDLLMLEALPGRLGRVPLAVVGKAAEAGCRALVEQHRDVRVQ